MEPTRHSVLATARFARGFTLIEMIVVLAIISTLTTVILIGHSNFDRTLLITDTAYSAALSIREMQTFGLSSRNFNGITNTGYGVYVSSLTPTAYTLFADTAPGTGAPAYCPVGTSGTPDFKPGDCLYESTGTADGLISTYTLTRGFRISDFCGKETSSGVRHCMSEGYFGAFDAVFLRPNTDSIMSAQKTSAGTPWVQVSSGEIYFQTADAAATRGVCISSIGQISVVTGTCP